MLCLMESYLGQCRCRFLAHLLDAVGLFPVVGEGNNDADALLAHLVQDVVDGLEHRLIVLACIAWFVNRVRA